MRGMHKGNYVLTGYMGSGKSTVGKKLASMTGMTFQDLDLLLEERSGMSISRIFELETEKGFRDRESALIRDLVEEGRTGVVYSAGGGAPLREENRRLLKRLGRVIWLDVSAETVIERLSGAVDRPLLQRPDREAAVKAMLKERRSAYEACADARICADGKYPVQIAREILREEDLPAKGDEYEDTGH
jgi:shikimate kinase